MWSETAINRWLLWIANNYPNLFHCGGGSWKGRLTNKWIEKWGLDSNNKSKSLNNTYLNIIKIFIKLFKKMNTTEMQNLVVTSTQKNGHFKFKRKILIL